MRKNFKAIDSIKIGMNLGQFKKLEVYSTFEIKILEELRDETESGDTYPSNDGSCSDISN